MVIIAEARVVIALRRPWMGRCRSRGPSATLLALYDVVVFFAIQRTSLSQRELVSWHELSRALATPETFNMVDFTFRAHHKVVFTEGASAFIAFRAKQSET